MDHGTECAAEERAPLDSARRQFSRLNDREFIGASRRCTLGCFVRNVLANSVCCEERLRITAGIARLPEPLSAIPKPSAEVGQGEVRRDIGKLLVAFGGDGGVKRTRTVEIVFKVMRVKAFRREWQLPAVTAKYFKGSHFIEAEGQRVRRRRWVAPSDFCCFSLEIRIV